MKQKHLVIFSAVFLLVAFIAGTFYYRSKQANAAVEAYRRDRLTFVRDYSPSHGDLTVQLRGAIL